jgi:Ca-activated chloride channel family protein
MGFWLLLMALPVCLGAFRRGWILGIVLLVVMPVEESHAFEWQDLWLTPDQRANRLLEQGDAEAAAQTFRNPDWSGAAHYQAGEFESAEQAFANADSADNWYNRGNALARGGKLDEALAAYDEALARQPDLEDATFNRELVEQLKQQTTAVRPAGTIRSTAV